MKKTGSIDSPLHYGSAPKWLFSRMSKLAREISLVIIKEYGRDELLEKLSNPLWFQAFGCVLGFDWHSSGLTTTVCGALKEGLKDMQYEIGFFVAGGKGATSKKTPDEIIKVSDKLCKDFNSLVYASRISAKVDNSAVQDGYSLYHHVFFFTKEGKWAVVQQGMNSGSRFARRYHWLSSSITDFVCEPHTAVCGKKESGVLNLVSLENSNLREKINTISKIHPDKNIKLPLSHSFGHELINPKKLYKVFIKTYEKQPNSFEEMLSIKGVGPKSLRALSLIAELVYGEKADFSDPVRYSFAHGGKDGYPYFVNRGIYDKSIMVLKDALESAKIGDKDKLCALKRLSRTF